MSFVSDFGALKDIINNIATNAKVSRFSYNSNAYNNNNYSGVSTFSVGNDNNIPTSDADTMNVNESVVDYGFRSQASTISRMLMNHFFGRISYNLNKIYDVLNAFMQLLYTSRGQANGFASLDQNGRVPVTQLPVDTLVYVDDWDASTNTPHLEDGVGTKGDFYIVTTAGTQTFGGITYNFLVNDRIVYGVSGTWKKLAGGAQSKAFTYIVDSNASLAYWLTNKQSGTSSGGDDFTSVLIRKGEWNFTGETVALDTIGTVYIEGEAGSKLVFTDTEKALQYSSLDTTVGRAMKNITVDCTRNVSGSSYAFLRCSNIINCTSTVIGTDYGQGFVYCSNLINCISTGTGTGNGTDIGNGCGFFSCSNLTNCTGTGTGTGIDAGVARGYGYGFYNCSNLASCTGTGTGTSFVRTYGFSNCSNLINCAGTGTGTGTTYVLGYGFYECSNLINCTGTATARPSPILGQGIGFSKCSNLTNCTGTGTGTEYGSGFYECKIVHGCKAGGHCSFSVFDSSYASSLVSSTYACANSANGGFNDTTNPAA